MTRNSEQRLGASVEEEQEASAPVAPPQAHAFSFTTPTEFVELPSKGRYYPTSHPLHMKEEVEVRFMTAKEEDILTSKTLLKKGVAIDRLVDSILVDKRINSDMLLTGDKNAILIAARIGAFGEEYNTQFICPVCMTPSVYDFNLGEARSIHTGQEEHEYDVKPGPNGTYVVTLPRTKIDVAVRLLTGKEEKKLTQLSLNKKKQKLSDTPLIDQLRVLIVSVNGHEERHIVEQFITNAPAADTRYLRYAYRALAPQMVLKQNFECEECMTTTEVEVPINSDFFWPKR